MEPAPKRPFSGRPLRLEAKWNVGGVARVEKRLPASHGRLAGCLFADVGTLAGFRKQGKGGNCGKLREPNCL